MRMQFQAGTDPNDLSDSQKRRMAGYCCFNCLGLTSTAAFICAICSYAYCDFVTRTVELNDGYTVDSVCSEFGAVGGQEDICTALLNEHGIGFDYFWVTVPVDQQLCYPYTLLTPSGYVTPSFDTKFNSARALCITAIVLGGAAWFTLMLGSCCKLDQAKLKGLACYFFLATLFQGLSLLIFRSNVCSPGFFTPYFNSGTEITDPDQAPVWMKGVSCGLSKGSNLAVAATVLWFVCSNMLPAAVVPEPLWEGPAQELPPGVAPAQKEEAAAEEGAPEQAAAEEA